MLRTLHAPAFGRAAKEAANAFETMDREPPDAILMMPDTLTVLNLKHVFDFSRTARVRF
jgi:hypothetical protein